MPFSVGSVVWRVFFFAMLAIIGFASLIALAAFFFRGNSREMLKVFGVLFFLESPVVVLYTAVIRILYPVMRPKILVWKGQLIARVGLRLLIAPVSQCTWFEGKASQTTVWKFGFLFPGKAILVNLPQSIAKDGNRVAVGFSDETREL